MVRDMRKSAHRAKCILQIPAGDDYGGGDEDGIGMKKIKKKRVILRGLSVVRCYKGNLPRGGFLC